MITNEYTAPYETELADYYATLPDDVSALKSAIDAALDSLPDAPSYTKKAAIYRIMADGCRIRLFPHYPLFFEFGSGRRRTDWGVSCPLGRRLLERGDARFADCGGWHGAYQQEIRPYVARGLFHGWSPVGLDHHAPGYEYILQKGFAGLRDEALAGLGKSPDDAFLRAAADGCDAVITLAHRFRDEALAADAPDDAARRNLAEIAEVAARVPEFPAATFREALNAVIMSRETIGSFEGLGLSTLGRLDWLLAPYYAGDRAEAKRLIHALLAYTELRFDMDNRSSETSTTIVIGGCDPDGNVIFNEITEIILEAYTEGKYFGTKLIARTSAAHPAAYTALLGAFIAGGHNTLVIQNDDVLLAAHTRQGKSLRDARRYVCGGCHEIVLGGCEVHTRADSWINMPGLLLAAMDRAVYPDYTSFYLAVMAEVRAFHDKIANIKNKYERYWPDCDPAPLLSSTLDDCIKNRRDLTAGGARYNSVSLSMVGAATFVDSLYAVREAVYGENAIVSYPELVAALKTNFENNGELRHKLLSLPKFGGANRLDTAFAAKVLRDLSSCAGQPNARGGHFLPAFYPHSLFQNFGETTGATPDGRYAHEVLSRGVSPSESTEGGVTDAIGMLADIDLAAFDDSFVCDLTLPAGGCDGDVIAAIIKTFVADKGSALQINALNVADLMEAKANPDLHKNIIVRVCGYSERFCYLPPNVKDEVIHRAMRG